MDSLLPGGIVVRRTPWKDPVAWTAAGAGMAALALLGALLWHDAIASALVLVALAGVLAASGWVLCWRLGLHLGGTLLVYDLVRAARRGRHASLRCIYATLLLGCLFWSYTSWVYRPRGTVGPAAGVAGPQVQARQMARFATSFFGTFLGVQFAAVLIFTPVFVASAITEEKERRTLEFLFTTDLGNHEIVLGKLLARLAHLGLLLLTGLPVLSVLQFLGGVDPNLVLLGFAGTAAFAVTAGCLALALSIVSRTTVDAVTRTYLWLFAFLFLSPCIPVVGAGNPVSALAISSTGAPWTFGVYLAFHALVSLGLCVWMILRLRKRSLETMQGPSPLAVARVSRRAAAGDASAPRPHPPVGDYPLLWKEMHVTTQHLHPLLGGVLILVISGSLIVCIFYVLYVFHQPRLGLTLAGWLQAGLEANPALCGVHSMLVTIALVLIGFRAAACLSREREQQTLDSLLTVPWDRRELLTAKVLGAALGPTPLWMAIVLLWALGLIATALHPLAVLALVAATTTLACFAALIGTWFSLTQASTLRATLCTLVVLFLSLAGPWLVGGSVIRLFFPWLTPMNIKELTEKVILGLTPSAALAILAFPLAESGSPLHTSTAVGSLLKVLPGLACYLAADVVLWLLVVQRFQSEAGPKPRRREIEA